MGDVRVAVKLENDGDLLRYEDGTIQSQHMNGTKAVHYGVCRR
ncbi:MAG: hypothetical protein U9R02_03885 [Thermodesulfobacteriota bacterium]|nr:hypothetical protein [Thermodesulfobacteriota bacterium]